MRAGAIIIAAAMFLSSQSIAQTVARIDSSQEESIWMVGVMGGVTYNTYLLNARVIINAEGVPTYDPVRGTGWQIGLTGEYRFGERMGVGVNILHTTRPGSNRQPLPFPHPEPLSGYDDSTQSHRFVSILDIRHRSIDIEALATLRALRLGSVDLALAAGPALYIVSEITLRQALDVGHNYTTHNTDPAYTEQGGHVLVFYDRAMTIRRSIRYSLVAGLFADIHLGDDLLLTPGLLYTHTLFDPEETSGWCRVALDARIGVRYRY